MCIIKEEEAGDRRGKQKQGLQAKDQNLEQSSHDL